MSHRRAAGLLLLVALAARVALLAATPHLPLANDPADYQRLAVSISSGHGFGTTVVAPGGGPTAFRPPLWPLFLAGLYWVVGAHVVVARAVEVVLGVLTVALVGVLARRLVPGPAGRRAALVAVGLAAVYPPLLLAGGSLLSESLSLPIELGSLLAALAAARSDRPLRWCAAAGLLCGLDILCRPDSFILLVPAVLVAVLAGRSGRATGVAPAEGAGTGVGARAVLTRGGVIVGVAALAVTPWLVRDAVVMGRFIPVTTQGGLVASGTYNDTAAHDPAHPAAWRPANLVPEYVPLLKGTEVQEEAALRAASLHYIRTHPTYPFRVAGWNLLRLFDLRGRSVVRASWGANGYPPAAADLDLYGLGLLAALAVGGAVIPRLRAGRRRGVSGRVVTLTRGAWAVGLAPVLLILVTIPVLGESRLRVGVDPFLVLGAALLLAG